MACIISLDKIRHRSLFFHGESCFPQNIYALELLWFLVLFIEFLIVELLVPDPKLLQETKAKGYPEIETGMRGTAVLRCWGKRLKASEECKKAELLAQKVMMFKSYSKSCDASQLWWSTLSFGQRSSLVQVSMSPTLVIKKFLYYSGRFATTIARTGSVCWIGASMLSWAMSLCGLCGTYVEPMWPM